MIADAELYAAEALSAEVDAASLVGTFQPPAVQVRISAPKRAVPSTLQLCERLFCLQQRAAAEALTFLTFSLWSEHAVGQGLPASATSSRGKAESSSTRSITRRGASDAAGQQKQGRLQLPTRPPEPKEQVRRQASPPRATSTESVRSRRTAQSNTAAKAKPQRLETARVAPTRSFGEVVSEAERMSTTQSDETLRGSNENLLTMCGRLEKVQNTVSEACQLVGILNESNTRIVTESRQLASKLRATLSIWEQQVSSDLAPSLGSPGSLGVTVAPEGAANFFQAAEDETNGVDWDLSRVSSPSLVPSVAGSTALSASLGSASDLRTPRLHRRPDASSAPLSPAEVTPTPALRPNSIAVPVAIPSTSVTPPPLSSPALRANIRGVQGHHALLSLPRYTIATSPTYTSRPPGVSCPSSAWVTGSSSVPQSAGGQATNHSTTTVLRPPATQPAAHVLRPS
mmetsp:Transcript_22239/g.50760  ORF Transcript_22239/g.50760 Transcript_22239/m.50760 type:complete len:457 (+) Transcript_22239:60-1430(+)